MTEILTEPPVAGSEIDTLIGSLERQRRIFAWKTGGLDATGLAANHPPSTMSLGGLVKHLALVEDEYFCVRLLGRDPAMPWADVDWDAEPDWEWRTAADDTPDQLYALWQETVERARAAIDQALAADGLAGLASYQNRNGESPSLRRILIDMIEEYARHIGHADLLRESVDGLTGEEPSS